MSRINGEVLRQIEVTIKNYEREKMCIRASTGSLNVFNHRSNVNIENRVVSFDIKELGKQLKKIGMLVVQDAVWNRVTINREQRKSTRYYIDEMRCV